MKTPTTFTIFILSIIISASVYAQNPGGVTGANLWLKANDGASNSGSNLTGWIDKTSTNTFTVTGTPGFINNGLNFHPLVTFNNTQSPQQLPVMYLAGDNSITVSEAFAVYKKTVTQCGTLIGSSTSFALYGAQILGGYNGNDVYVSHGVDNKYYSWSNALLSATNMNVVSVDLSSGGTSVKFYANGIGATPTVHNGATYSSLSLTPWIGGTNNNGNANGWSHFVGEVAEIITYPTSLSTDNRNKVISYLAIKYGILILAPSLNYIASNGTILYDNANSNTYRNDVFGIGRDDASGLNITSSNSIETGSGDGTGQSGKGNIVLSNPSGMTDGEFMLIGHDAAALTFSNTELPGSMTNYNRTAREWYVEKTGDVGTVTLTFDMTGIPGISVGGSASDYAILLDTDNDFTTGATTVDASSLIGNVITFSGLTLADGQYITFAGKESVLPVTLKSFTSSVSGRNVKLSWVTEKEINNKGFELERAEVTSQNKEFRNIGFVNGQGTKNTPTSYSYEDKSLNTGKFDYRLKQVDNNGNYEYHELSGNIEVGVPKKYDLSQNYPNPFNPVTKINFDIPENGLVNIRLYDMLGREVAVLVNEVRNAGYYTVQFDASKLSSGIYFYKMNAGNFNGIKKMAIVK